MNDEPENHTLTLLREMRAEIGARFDRLETRIGSLEARIGSLETRIGSLETRVEALEAISVKTMDAVIALAKSVDKIAVSSKIIESRVVRIEAHLGMVDA